MEQAHHRKSRESLYLNSPGWGFLWTSEALFPVLYRFHDKSWVCYVLECDESVRFYNLTVTPN